MLMKQLTGGTVGGDKDYVIVGYTYYDRTGTFTIPSDVDFVIVAPLFPASSSGTWRTFSNNVKNQDMLLKKVGDSITQNYTTQAGTDHSTTQTITWTNATTVTCTKSDYNDGYMLFACQYV